MGNINDFEKLDNAEQMKRMEKALLSALRSLDCIRLLDQDFETAKKTKEYVQDIARGGILMTKDILNKG